MDELVLPDPKKRKIPAGFTYDFEGGEVDETDYIYFRIHKDLKPIYEKILIRLAQEIEVTKPRPNIEIETQTSPKLCPLQENSIHHVDLPHDGPMDDSASAKALEAYFEAFDRNKSILNTYMEDFTSHELTSELKGDLFSKFKYFRKKLTDWYETNQRLFKYNKKHSDSTKFLKCQLSFSPSIDNGPLKTSVIQQIKGTVDGCENKLSIYAIQNALDKQEELFEEIDHIFVDSRNEKRICVTKAFRSVLKAHPRTYAEVVKSGPQNVNSKETYRNRNVSNNRRQSFRNRNYQNYRQNPNYRQNQNQFFRNNRQYQYKRTYWNNRDNQNRRNRWNNRNSHRGSSHAEDDVFLPDNRRPSRTYSETRWQEI